MTKEKWVEIVKEEANKMCIETVGYLDGNAPQKWIEAREVVLSFVKAVDEATEVYNMEKGE